MEGSRPAAPTKPVYLAPYGGAGQPVEPIRDNELRIVEALAQNLPKDANCDWPQILRALIARLRHERHLAAAAARFVPEGFAAGQDPPAWLVYLGDTLRAAGIPLPPRLDDLGWDAHPLLTNDPTPALPPQAPAEPTPESRMAAALARLEPAERGVLEMGAKLISWPRGTDGMPVAEIHVGLAPNGEPLMTVPAANRLQQEGAITWERGRARLTEAGRAAFLAYCAVIDAEPVQA